VSYGRRQIPQFVSSAQTIGLNQSRDRKGAVSVRLIEAHPNPFPAHKKSFLLTFFLFRRFFIDVFYF